MLTTRRIAVAVGALVVLIAAFISLTRAHEASPQVVFSYAGISIASNTKLISIAITNQTTLSIVYFVGDPVLESNSVWGSFQYPTGTKLVGLGAGESATEVISAPIATGAARVPVLWGFTYSPKANRWQAVREGVATFFRMRDFRGRGALYTNYVTGIHL